MHCKPLVIDYVMYALIVCLVLLTCKGPSHQTFVLVSGDQTFAFGDYFYQLLSIGPFPKKLAPKKLAPKKSLQVPSRKIFWLKH